MRYQISIAVFAVLLLAGVAQAYKSYQMKIPNGPNVSNPCNGTLWPGVGHWNINGDGDRNPFGMAFASNSQVWNTVLCRLDSDGDGKTNGQELGDPDCVWTVGATPSRTTGITHPGVCEPVDSVLCKLRNGDKITCGSAALKGTFGVLCGLLLMALMMR